MDADGIEPTKTVEPFGIVGVYIVAKEQEVFTDPV